MHTDRICILMLLGRMFYKTNEVWSVDVFVISSISLLISWRKLFLYFIDIYHLCFFFCEFLDHILCCFSFCVCVFLFYNSLLFLWKKLLSVFLGRKYWSCFYSINFTLSKLYIIHMVSNWLAPHLVPVIDLDCPKL